MLEKITKSVNRFAHLPVTLFSNGNINMLALVMFLVDSTENDLTSLPCLRIGAQPEGENFIVHKTLPHHVVPERGKLCGSQVLWKMSTENRS